MKFRLAAITLAFSAFASAQSYNTLIDLTHSDSGDFEGTSIGITHYFTARDTRGPLDEFSFINSNSFLRASYNNSDFIDSTNISGQWYADNGLFLGAGYTYTDTDSPFLVDTTTDTFSGTIGYQAAEQWSVSATLLDTEDADTVVLFNASYEHDLGNNDYLAFNYSTNDDTDFHTIGTRYFNSLDNGQYLVLNAEYTDFDSGNESWSVGGSWHFNQKTSLFAGIGDEDFYQLGARHYFNENWALSVAYADSDIAADGTWGANIRVQF